MCVTKWRFSEKKFKPGVSQNTGYFIWLICFDPSNSKATSCSKAVTRQGNELLAYDCHQLTLFLRRISSYPKNFKMLLFVARVTEDVGDLSSVALAFCCRESGRNLHPRVLVDQAGRPLPPKENLAF